MRLLTIHNQCHNNPVDMDTPAGNEPITVDLMIKILDILYTEKLVFMEKIIEENNKMKVRIKYL